MGLTRLSCTESTKNMAGQVLYSAPGVCVPDKDHAGNDICFCFPNAYIDVTGTNTVSAFHDTSPAAVASHHEWPYVTVQGTMDVFLAQAYYCEKDWQWPEDQKWIGHARVVCPA